MMKVSNCCGVPPRWVGDLDSEDFGICPDCREPCEYIDEDEFDEENIDDDTQEYGQEVFKEAVSRA